MYCPNCGVQNPDAAFFCSGCGRNFPGQFAAPQAAAYANVAAPRVEGNQLVLPRGAQLPPVCLKCGQPASRYLSINYQWLSPLLWVLIFIGLIGWIIIAVLTKRMKVQTPLCEEHIAARKQKAIIGTVMLLASIPLAILVGYAISGDAGVGWGVLVFFILFIAGLVVIGLRNPVKTTRIDDFGITFGGVHPSVLALLGGPQAIVQPR